eukprot:4646154-Prymnesium_polylepis.3
MRVGLTRALAWCQGLRRGGELRVRQVVVSTGVTTTLAGSGSASFADGTGASAAFNEPLGVAVSPDGLNVFVADVTNFRIRQVRDVLRGQWRRCCSFCSRPHVSACPHAHAPARHPKRNPISAARQAASATPGGSYFPRAAGARGCGVRRGACEGCGRVRVRSCRCTVQDEG